MTEPVPSSPPASVDPTDDSHDGRGSWDEYFLRIAVEVSSRATCIRRRVGCVIVRDRSILATGFNGSVRGQAHCAEVGCLMENDHCVRTVHAESNAIVQAALNGTRISGSTFYVTANPCWDCLKMIANAGIVRVVFGEPYPNERGRALARSCGIELVSLVKAGGTS